MSYALITGASKGIGKAIAEELASKGFDLLLVARTESLLQELSENLSAKYKISSAYMATDLTEKESVQKITAWCLSGQFPVSMLINNAGFGICGEFGETPISRHLSLMYLNMNVPVQLCYSLLPLLKTQEKAYILNIGSTTAYHAIPLMSLYAASKVFILRFSRGLHYELRHTAVSVTCVCPGSTETDFPQQAGVSARTIKMGKKFTMSPQKVAQLAVAGMLAGKKEVVPGFINKLSVFLAWLFPASWAEKTAMKLFK